jgi:transketolase
LAAEFVRRMAGKLPEHFAGTVDAAFAAMGEAAATVATRKASQLALDVLTPKLPELLGGSADLTGSNLTNTAATPALRVQAQVTASESAEAVIAGQFTQLVGEALKAVSSQAAGAGAASEAVKLVSGGLFEMLKSPKSASDKPRYSLNSGRHINYGVREFGMAAIMNGAALHGGLIPYGGTFLTFSDYSRNAIRMAALMKLRVVHVFTHDSIGLGEDGPTHQSVEHAASLRLIPNLDVWRPCDTQESLVAWASAIDKQSGPSALLLSRQALPFAPKSAGRAEIGRGGYVLSEPADVGAKGAARAVIIATGSEVSLALVAQERLAKEGIAVRVVSMPCTNAFDRQSREYKLSVLPAKLPRIAVEAGVTDGWWKYGCAAVLGLDTYGESAPAPELFAHFGITAESLVEITRSVI